MGRAELTVAEVLRRAAGAPGMLAFFAVVGARIRHGDCRRAFLALRGVPLEPTIAWRIVDRWQALGDVERLTGWTPEVAAMEAVMRETGAWRAADWTALIRRCVGTHE